MSKTISTADLQGAVLDLLDEHTEFVITKDGEPVAMVVPLTQTHGPMYGTIEFSGDIVAPLDEEWHADR